MPKASKESSTPRRTISTPASNASNGSRFFKTKSRRLSSTQPSIRDFYVTNPPGHSRESSSQSKQSSFLSNASNGSFFNGVDEEATAPPTGSVVYGGRTKDNLRPVALESSADDDDLYEASPRRYPSAMDLDAVEDNDVNVLPHIHEAQSTGRSIDKPPMGNDVDGHIVRGMRALLSSPPKVQERSFELQSSPPRGVSADDHQKANTAPPLSPFRGELSPRPSPESTGAKTWTYKQSYMVKTYHRNQKEKKAREVAMHELHNPNKKRPGTKPIREGSTRAAIRVGSSPTPAPSRRKLPARLELKRSPPTKRTLFSSKGGSDGLNRQAGFNSAPDMTGGSIKSSVPAVEHNVRNVTQIDHLEERRGSGNGHSASQHSSAKSERGPSRSATSNGHKPQRTEVRSVEEGSQSVPRSAASTVRKHGRPQIESDEEDFALAPLSSGSTVQRLGRVEIKSVEEGSVSVTRPGASAPKVRKVGRLVEVESDEEDFGSFPRSAASNFRKVGRPELPSEERDSAFAPRPSGSTAQRLGRVAVQSVEEGSVSVPRSAASKVRKVGRRVEVELEEEVVVPTPRASASDVRTPGHNDMQPDGEGFVDIDRAGEEDPRRYELPLDVDAMGEAGMVIDLDVGEEVIGDGSDSLQGDNPGALSIEQVPAFLYEDMVVEAKFGGCSQQAHANALRHHRMIFEGGCNQLSATFPRDIPTQSGMGIHARVYPDKRAVKQKEIVEENKRFLEGITPAVEIDGVREPGVTKHICLHLETEGVSSKPSIVYDVDSHLSIPKNLEVLKDSFMYHPGMHDSDMIKKDIHVRVKCNFVSKRTNKPVQQTLPVKDIPHRYLGYSEALGRTTVFAFFPAMCDDRPKKEKKPFQHLSTDLKVRWAQLFLSSLDLREDQKQHMPMSMMEADSRNMAYQREANGGRRDSHYSLSRSNLKGIEGRMRQKILEDKAEYWMFEDFFLFTTAKGLKLQFKNPDSFGQCLDRFHDAVQAAWDTEFIHPNLFWVDIGKEITPPARPAYAPPGADPVDPKVFLYKSCCLKSVHERYKRKVFGGSSGQHTVYHTGTLRDAAAMTISPPRRSVFFAAGGTYSQWYTLVKEKLDAFNLFPFSHKDIPELALDADLFGRPSAGGRKRKSRNKKMAKATDSYMWSKQRWFTSYHERSQSSYGSRKEHRITWRLFLALRQHTHERESEAREAGSNPIMVLQKCPRYIHEVDSEKFCKFMIGNMHKLTQAFEYGISQCDRHEQTIETAKVLYIILLLIQNFQSMMPGKLKLLEMESSGQATGMGIATQREVYGFGWFLPRIDWNSYKMKGPYQKSTFVARLQYQRLVKKEDHQSQMTANQAICLYLELLRQYHQDRRARTILVHLVCHVCMRLYRRTIKKKLRDTGGLLAGCDPSEFVDDVRYGEEGVTRVFSEPIHWSNPRHGNAKKVGQVHDLIWGLPNEAIPNANKKKTPVRRFELEQFRDLWIFACDGASTIPGVLRDLTTTMVNEFWRYHYVIPALDNGSLVGKMKAEKGEVQKRRWLAVQPSMMCFIEQPVSGLPPWPPRQLEFDRDRLVAHLLDRSVDSLSEGRGPVTGGGGLDISSDEDEDEDEDASDV